MTVKCCMHGALCQLSFWALLRVPLPWSYAVLVRWLIPTCPSSKLIHRHPLNEKMKKPSNCGISQQSTSIVLPTKRSSNVLSFPSNCLTTVKPHSTKKKKMDRLFCPSCHNKKKNRSFSFFLSFVLSCSICIFVLKKKNILSCARLYVKCMGFILSLLDACIEPMLNDGHYVNKLKSSISYVRICRISSVRCYKIQLVFCINDS